MWTSIRRTVTPSTASTCSLQTRSGSLTGGEVQKPDQEDNSSKLCVSFFFKVPEAAPFAWLKHATELFPGLRFEMQHINFGGESEYLRAHAYGGNASEPEKETEEDDGFEDDDFDDDMFE